jgi:hypothetical protein
VSGILDADHNISPCLEKQLVLELELGVEVLELPEQLPGSVLSSHALLLKENVPNIAVECRRRQETPIHGGRHHPRGWRRVAAVRLQQAHVEDIMQTGALRELDAMSLPLA